MRDSLLITEPITRARSNSKFIEIRVGASWFALHQNSRADLRILANLYRPYIGRARMMANDLVRMVIEAEIVFDIDGAAPDSLAWANPEGLGFIDAGPALVSAASIAFFGKPVRRECGRHPAAVRAARVDADGTARPCVFCGAPAAETNHIMPVALGGGDELDNEEPACADCHDAHHRTTGVIRIAPGWYDVEVVAAVVDGVVAVAIARGPLGGRRYKWQWSSNLISLLPDALYRVCLDSASPGRPCVIYAETQDWRKWHGGAAHG